MEELKFRAWHHVDSVMLFADIYEMQNIDGEWTIWDLPIDSPTNTGTSLNIDQFTNQKDDDGKELYTGDIVCISGSGSCIVGISPLHGVTYTCIADDGLSTCAHDVIAEQENIFLIGNIHQNPELLERKQ